MDVEQSIISELEELKGRFDMPYNSTDKRTIRRLYREVLGKEMRQTSCQTCYHDAVVEMFYHINHNGKMARKRKYLLKAGAMIQSADIDNGKVYTNANLTDSVAARYLRKHPARAILFQRMPRKAEKAPQAAAAVEGGKLQGQGAQTASEVKENGK